ncbi:MAG: heat shock protein HspQ [Rhodospirillaceae bacterium]
MSQERGIVKRIAALFGRRKKAAEEEQVKASPRMEFATEEVAAERYGSDQERPYAIDRRQAKFQIGQVVQHRFLDFRGVIFDVDPEFANTDEWYEAIPEDIRPRKDQPYYHLFAENDKTHYVAYVSEGNLVPDDSDTPVSHPDIQHFFEMTPTGYALKSQHAH